MNRFAAISLVLWLLSGHAWAQALSPNQQLEKVRGLFERSDFKECLRFSREALATSNFTDPQRIELNKYAGLSAFNLGELPGAEEHLYRLLLVDPDYQLDPFEVPPAAMAFFAELKRKNSAALEVVRLQVKKRFEQARLEAEQRERQRSAEEERRRRLEQLSKQLTVRTVERRSLLLNFVPFGAGQFQQGRTATGLTLASVEGALAATSVVAYFGFGSLSEEKTYVFRDRLGTDEPVSITVRGIPPSRMGEASTWKLVKYVSGAAFYAVYTLGVADALYHHKDEVVTTTVMEAEPPVEEKPPPKHEARPPPEERRPPLVPPPPEPIPAKMRGPPEPAVGPRAFLFPTPGGLGAGLQLHF
ncbi:MAG: hypothetical protein HYZ28_07295 [Myxococcales bacterium]|nr:hypothetical protein [Myxococcales bacterium]